MKLLWQFKVIDLIKDFSFNSSKNESVYVAI